MKISGLELNGVANIDMIIQTMEMQIEDGMTAEQAADYVASIREQLDTLNRYMTAVSKEIHANHKLGKDYVEPPLWHEVRDNKDKYKTNGGK